LSQLHRLAWIDAEIRRGAYPNCGTIARRFEISSRQASRDVEYLRYSMGAPVEYSAERNGYFYSEDTFVMPAYILSDSEKEALGYLAFQYSNLGSERGMRLAELFRAIGGRESAVEVRGLAAPEFSDTEAASYAALERAANARKKAKIAYRGYDGGESERKIHPYKLFTKAGSAYVVGYCELRKEPRVFRLSRVLAVRETEEDFFRVAEFRESDYGEDSPFAYSAPHEAVVEFDRTDELGPTAMRAERLGPRTYRLEFRKSEELIRFLLARGEGFTIKSPAWLRERLRETLRGLAERNE
jgi:predicted DNA-binding transcriptional regulator YafY